MSTAWAPRAPRRWLVAWGRIWVRTAGLVLAVGCGVAIAQGGTRRALVLAIAGLLAALPFLHAVFTRRAVHGFLTVEVPLAALLFSTLVLRIRSAQDIANDPLDPAAQFRVALIMLALGLGLIALISPPRIATHARVLNPISAVYAAYVVVVFLGAPLSVNPILTIYRGVELASALVVVAAARRTVGADASRRLGDVLYWFAVALLISVWLGVVLFPERALSVFQNLDVRWTFQVSGVFPELSSNSVGALGVLVAAWAIARLHAGQTSRIRGYTIAALGVLSVLAAQYRTGYVALLLAVGAWLLIRRRWGLAASGVAIGVAIVLLYPSLITEAQPYVLRGQTTEEAAELSSRVAYWKASIPVWLESPILGRGLLTGTRYEVLAPLGLDTTSSIHSTWFEALVGTGVVGVVLLLACFLMLFRRAFHEARRPTGWKVPFMILSVLLVRSLTGSTFESFDYFALVFLWLASSVDEWPLFRRQAIRVNTEPAAA